MVRSLKAVNAWTSSNRKRTVFIRKKKGKKRELLLSLEFKFDGAAVAGAKLLQNSANYMIIIAWCVGR